MDGRSRPLLRAQAASEIAGAALALARARDLLADEPDGATSHLIEYVTGWANRALIECLEPSPDTVVPDHGGAVN